jgi:hypothetical protein
MCRCQAAALKQQKRLVSAVPFNSTIGLLEGVFSMRSVPRCFMRELAVVFSSLFVKSRVEF